MHAKYENARKKNSILEKDLNKGNKYSMQFNYEMPNWLMFSA